MMRPWTTVSRPMLPANTPSVALRGLRFITSPSASSMPSASAGEAVGHEVHPQKLDGLEQREAHERRREHAEYLGQVRGQQELDDLTDVVVDATTLFARIDDRGEVVVGKHHVGNVLGDVGAGDAHADADVRVLDGGSIVHTVARHGNDLVLGLPSLDDAGLVLGLNASVHAVLLDVLIELFLRHLVDLGTGDGLAAILDDTEVLGDSHGGVDVVTRDS